MIGNIRKMEVSLEGNEAKYQLRLYNNLIRPEETVDMNSLVGKDIQIDFTGNINCVVTGKKIPKAYGEGMSWDAFQSSPMADQSIVSPELSTAHLGIERRDLEWEITNHVTPHFVYISFTSGFKVGVTRHTQIPIRWIDQGAVAAIAIAKTPYRQAAGKIEVALKNFVNDKTNWRKMLVHQSIDETKILELKKELTAKIPEELKPYIITEDEHKIQFIDYPVQDYPTKITTLKLDKTPLIEKKLMGIKGQYLIFADNTVFNMRAHTAYQISLNW
jgi:hypothetical protein